MVVDIPYVIRVESGDIEFSDATSLLISLMRTLVDVPEAALPVVIEVVNVDEFSIERIERNEAGIVFLSENKRSKLGKHFKKFMEEFLSD